MKGKAPRTKGVQEPPPGYNEPAIVIYETADGVRLDVNLEKETLLLEGAKAMRKRIRLK